MMKGSTAKERMLKKIRQALSTPVPVPFPQSEGSDSVYHPAKQDLEAEFAENFTKLQGRFSFCLSMQELALQLNQLATLRKWKTIFCQEAELVTLLEKYGFSAAFTQDLANCDASFTFCESLIARTGSIVLSSALPHGRTGSVYAPVHVCVAFTGQLVYDIKDALTAIAKKYGDNIPSLITLATGPSRTADIEKTLVVGVHGPKEVFCFLTDQQAIP